MLHAVHCFRVFLPALALVAVLTSAVRAHAAPPPEPAESFTLAGQTLVLNGSGTRHKAVFKVYNAHLYLPHKAQSYAQIAQMPGAKRREIHMLRDIDANELGKLFTKGIEHNTPRQHLGQVLPSVVQMGALFAHEKRLRKGDSFSLDWVPEAGLTISINGQARQPQFADPLFFNALLSIWLGDKPADSPLKQALLGLQTPPMDAN